MSNTDVLFICLVFIIAAIISEYINKSKSGEKAAMLSECEDKVIKIKDKCAQGEQDNVTQLGYNAGLEITTGNNNIALGYQSLVHLSGANNVAYIKLVPEKIDTIIDKFGHKTFIKTWGTGNTSSWGK